MIAETKQLEDETVAKLQSAVDDFKKQFKSSASAAVNEAAADALDSEAAEAITKHVPPAAKK